MYSHEGTLDEGFGVEVGLGLVLVCLARDSTKGACSMEVDHDNRLHANVRLCVIVGLSSHLFCLGLEESVLDDLWDDDKVREGNCVNCNDVMHLHRRCSLGR